MKMMIMTNFFYCNSNCSFLIFSNLQLFNIFLSQANTSIHIRIIIFHLININYVRSINIQNEKKNTFCIRINPEKRTRNIPTLKIRVSGFSTFPCGILKNMHLSVSYANTIKPNIS